MSSESDPKRSDLIFDAAGLSPAALERKHRLERDPSCRTDPMAYLPGMEEIDSDLKDRVRAAMAAYDPGAYSAADVRRALERDRCTEDDLRALLSPAAAPFLERMAERARAETVRHFGNTVYIFTPIYIANHCENYCVYCGFNCYNPIRRMRLDRGQIEREMDVVADRKSVV